MTKWVVDHSRGRRLSLASWGVLFFLSCGLLLFSTAEAGEKSSFLGDGMSFDGGVVQKDTENNAWVMTNHAVISIGELKITARNMVFFEDTREIYAEGNVHFEQKRGSIFDCEKLFFNAMTKQGTAIDVRMMGQAQTKKKNKPTNSIPLFIRNINVSATRGRPSAMKSKTYGKPRIFIKAKEVHLYGPKHAEAIGAIITPSSYAKPHWGIYTSAVNIRPGQKVESWNNVLKIGKVPVFYFPYIIRDLKYEWPWMRITGGRRSKWGVFADTEWIFRLNPKNTDYFRMEKLFYNLGWKERRGANFGLGGSYKVGHRKSNGYFRFQAQDESLTTDLSDNLRALSTNRNSVYKKHPDFEKQLYANKTRWGLDWWHWQEINDLWDVRAEAHVFSDPDYQFEYQEREFKNDKFPPETWLGIRRLTDNWIFEIIAQKRVNSYLNQSEYLPEIRVTVPGMQLAKWNLFWESDTRVGFVKRRVDKFLDRHNLVENDITRIKNTDKTPTFFRFVQADKLKMPILLGPAKLMPYIGHRTAFYGEQYGRSGGDSSNVDNFSSSLLYGFDLSTRLYGKFKNDTWRHVIEPTISYQANTKPSILPGQLYTIDKYDAYSEDHVWKFAVNQKWQTNDGKGIRDVINLDVSWRVYPLVKDANRRNFGRTVSEVVTDLIWRPTRSLTLWGNVFVDPQLGRVNQTSVGLDLYLLNRFRIYMTHFELLGDTFRRPGSNGISLSTVAFRTPLWNKDSNYSLEAAGRFDWSSTNTVTGLIEKRITIFRDFETFELGVSFVADEKTLGKNGQGDKGVYFTFSPKFGGGGGSESTTISDGAAQEALSSRYGGNPKAEPILDDKKDTESVSDTSPAGKPGYRRQSLSTRHAGSSIY